MVRLAQPARQTLTGVFAADTFLSMRRAEPVVDTACGVVYFARVFVESSRCHGWNERPFSVNVIENLLKLQDADRKVRVMATELADIPARKAQEQERLALHKKQVHEQADVQKHHLAELKKLELDVESFKDKIRKLRQQQLELKSNKEFRAMESEISSIETDIRGVEDKQLTLMDTIEHARNELKEREKALSEEESAVKRDMSAWDTRAGELQQAVAAEKTVRTELAKHVDPAWLAPYERVFDRKDTALVEVRDGICGGCHMQLPPFLAHEARKQKSVVTCGYCGRMLYSE